MIVVTIVGGHQVFAGTLDIGPDFLLSNVDVPNTKDLCSLTLRSHSKEDEEVSVANSYPSSPGFCRDIGPNFLISNVGNQNTKDLCSHSKKDDEADRGKFLSPSPPT